MKKSKKGIVIGVASFVVLTTGAFGVHTYNKAEQKKEIRAEIKELKKEHKNAVETYELHVAEYEYVKTLVELGEADNSRLEAVEDVRVEKFDKVGEIYDKIEELENQLKE
jgi:predicted nuclease with TOPRIM domain